MKRRKETREKMVISFSPFFVYNSFSLSLLHEKKNLRKIFFVLEESVSVAFVVVVEPHLGLNHLGIHC